MMRSRLPCIARGMGASLSIAIGYLPIAFSFGVAAIQAGLPPGIAMLASLLVYAGASQFLLISLLTSGASLWTVVPTVWLMNARHVLYGPALSVHAPNRNDALATPWLAFGLTDEVFATAMSKMPSLPQAWRDHWLLGLQLGAYAAWVGGTAAGVLFVREVQHWPAAVHEALDFVLPALFFALLLETGLRRWRYSILVAAGTALVLGCFLASHHALVLAMLAGAIGQAVSTQETA